jgi:hypothetical protein
MLVCRLAISTADPIVRLVAMSESPRSAKTRVQILGPDLVYSLADVAVPELLRPREPPPSRP